MQIKLIALDIDGTLINSQRKILPETKRALQYAHERGCTISLATGRAFMSLQDVLGELGCAEYAVTSNGSGIFTAAGESLFSARTPREMVFAVCDVCEKFGITPEVYIGGQAYCSWEQLAKMPSRGVPEKVCGYVRDTRVVVPNFSEFIADRVSDVEGMDILLAPKSLREELISALSAIENLSVTSSSPWYLDANVAGINKASGLAQLCQRLGIERESVMAFGDAENDVEMLQFAGFGVAMGNACESAKAVADCVTGSNDENGIADIIKKHL